jgi:hypothetical protein
MAFDVSALSAYIEDQDFPLAVKMQATGGLAQVANLQTGIKSSSHLQFMSSDVTFGDDGCSRTATDTTSFTQRTITVGGIAISEDLCVKDLNGYWTQTLLKQGVEGDVEIPAEQLWLEKKANALKNKLAKSDFQGDTGSGDANLNKYDGFIKIVDAASGVINGNSGAVTVATGVTEANILDILDGMWSAIPENIAEASNLSLHIPFAYYRMYIVALKNANLFHFKGEQGEVKLYGTNVTLRPTVGLSGVARMFLCADDNITIGMDGASDEENYDIRLNPNTNKSIYFDVTFKRGVQVAFPDEIVEFTLVP